MHDFEVFVSGHRSRREALMLCSCHCTELLHAGQVICADSCTFVTLYLDISDKDRLDVQRVLTFLMLGNRSLDIYVYTTTVTWLSNLSSAQKILSDDFEQE
jgi:hypothetical protein